MTGAELAEHSGYLADEVKLDAYRRALTAVIDADHQVVLDLGTGTGILGLLAAEAGARTVYAVDSGSIIGPARDVARRSRHADGIVHLRGRSTEVELPVPVDVAVCDQIGGFVHDAGVLGYFADARRRLLAPDGVLIPSRFRLYVAPVECPRIRAQIERWGSSPAGFDFAPFHELAVNTEHQVGVDELRSLAPGALVADITADHTDPIKGSGQTTIDQEGRCDGLVGWFEAELGGGVTITNDPRASPRIDRWCNVYPITESVDVRPGATVAADVDVRPLLNLMTWRVEIGAAGAGRRASERHSTLLGQFIAPDEVVRTKGAPIAATAAGRVLARALEGADGTRSTDEVIARATASLPDGSRESIDGDLRRLLLRYTAAIEDAD